MLEKVDEGVGMILAELERQGIADNTLIVLSSDNGGAHYSDNSPLFNGKASLWEGGIRVPCVARWPAKLQAGKVTHQPAITMDLTATFLSMARGAAAPDRPLDGIDLIPILTGQQPERSRTLCWRINRNTRVQKAIRHGPWKYVQDGGYLSFLYNLEDDISERKNLSFRHPEIVRDLKQKLAAWESDVDASEKDIFIH